MRRLAAKVADGLERNFTIVASLVDTNILVYRCDPRFPEKRETARTLLRRGLLQEVLRIPHQALVEFVSVVTRVGPDGHSLLPREEAWRQAEDIMMEFPILYPDAQVVRTALRGMAAYQLSWFDAHLWAYAEHYGLPEIISEDFEHGRLYGSVRVRNPFLV
jgi:predicted nucleic acid-binding protein